MTDRLYQLLPAIHRVRDAAEGEPLRALLALMEQEMEAVEADIEQLYANWFIETCDDWVVPYIGDLLGVRGLHAVGPERYSQRARVANTIGYRRRKGTAAMLEQLARDVTGWPARAAEFFQRLGTTQYLNHLRMTNLRTPDLRGTNRLELLGGPFESAAYTADVRHVANGRGRYNIPHVGLFLWRIQPYGVTRATAPAVSPGRYTFHPLGVDAPLFHQPQTEAEVDHLAEEVNVPAPLRRRPLYDELEARRSALARNAAPTVRYFGAQPPVRIYVGPDEDEVSPDELTVANLCDWSPPEATRTYVDADGNTQTLPIQVAFDPLLGRLMLAPGVSGPLVVSYAYGFSGDLGGGPYDRSQSATALAAAGATWSKAVALDPTVPGPASQTLGAALLEWSAQPAGTRGVITLLDSRSYKEDLTGLNAVVVKPGSELTIIAAPGQRPHLQGDLAIHGSGGSVALNGLLIDGDLTVGRGKLERLTLEHCTLVPGRSTLLTELNRDLQIHLGRCITGTVTLPDADQAASMRLSAEDCIISGAALRDDKAPAVVAPASPISLEAVTVMGSCEAQSLDASTCIFTGTVEAKRRQIGCVRFSYVSEESRVPRRYRCQPALALDEAGSKEERERILESLRPVFTAERYGEYGFGQLGRLCPMEVRTGAEDQSEMGAFHFLQQPQREANLRASLEEYLRFGLEAGLFYVT